MQEIFIAIALGAAVGLTCRLGYKVKLGLSRLSSACLALLLFCLGAKIGCDAELLDKLALLGWQALVLAAGTIFGSIVFMLPVLKFLARPEDSGEGAE